MKIRELAQHWEENAKGRLTQTGYTIHLDVEAAARLAAICDMYPKRQPEELLGELIGAALEELEASFPTSRVRKSSRPMKKATRCTKTWVRPRDSSPCPGGICTNFPRRTTNPNTDRFHSWLRLSGAMLSHPRRNTAARLESSAFLRLTDQSVILLANGHLR